VPLGGGGIPVTWVLLSVPVEKTWGPKKMNQRSITGHRAT